MQGFLLVALATPDWRTGLFAWGAGAPGGVGWLICLWPLSLGAWFLQPAQSWQWGSRHLTWPMLGLTLLTLTALHPMVAARSFTLLLGWGTVWGLYLFLLNERPRLTGILALLLLIQGGVAVAQFYQQGDLGLGAVGEYSLDPTVEGISVLWARGQPWLRAYGLTGHPNMLGALLATLLLFVLPELSQAQGWPQRGIALALTVGFLGLLVTFSRAAWLGFAGGLLLILGRASLRNALPFLLGLLCLLPYSDLVGSRWAALDTDIERRSITERRHSISLAVEMIQQHPWSGVGAGRYLEVARARQPGALIVHNVPLLVAVELGILGFVCWLWLMGAGFLGLRKRQPPFALWFPLLVIGLFDITLWPTTGIRNALLFALLSARLAIHLEDTRREPAPTHEG